MLNESFKSLYFGTGTFIVKPKGYWVTNGGDKGSFGFYPHLKDKNGMPFYADTQVQGDLKMAVTWRIKLEKDVHNQVVYPEISSTLFGKDRHSSTSKFICTDLIFSEESKNEWTSDRFKVKPKIQINKKTYVVEEQMFAAIESAYLNGLELKSEIYLGYFNNREEIELAQKLLEESLNILRGFGGDRSRGSGYGELSIKWEEIQEIKFSDEVTNPKPVYECYLRALSNVRNKALNPDGTQLIRSIPFLSQKSLRGWISYTYHDLFNEWPSIEEIGSIQLSTFYPAKNENGKYKLAYPAPTTTFRYDDNSIQDIWEQNILSDVLPKENFVKKPSRLSNYEYVTNEIKPEIAEIEAFERFRNLISDSFSTEDDGLFMQELFTKGSVFGGKIVFSCPESEFSKRVFFILQKMNLHINSSLFELAVLSDCHKEQQIGTSEIPQLVIEPIIFNGKELTDNNHNIINLGIVQSYNTTLKRPRRNRIVIKPGSILSSKSKNTISWPGFGKTIIKSENQSNESVSEQRGVQEESLGTKGKQYYQLSPSQIGQIRQLQSLIKQKEFLYIEKIISERLEKYKKWQSETINDKLIPKALLENIMKFLQESQYEKAQRYIDDFLEEAYNVRWNAKQQRIEIEFAEILGGQK